MSDTSKNQTSLDDLARMIQAGFEQTATKADLQALRTELKGDIGRVEGRLEKVEDRLEVVENKLDRALFLEVDRLEKRVKRLEEQVGISQ